MLSKKDWDYINNDKIPEKDIKKDLDKLVENSKKYAEIKELQEISSQKNKTKEDVEELISNNLKLKKYYKNKSIKLNSKVKQNKHNKKIRKYNKNHYDRFMFRLYKDDKYLNGDTLNEIISKTNKTKNYFLNIAIREYLISKKLLSPKALKYFLELKKQKKEKRLEQLTKKEDV